MTETKKRWRPSLTEYRALEKKIAELEEERNALRSKVSVLDLSNKSMEKGLEEERALRKKATEDYNKARNEVLKMQNRPFWQRVLNR